MARALIVQLSLSASAERRDARRILEADHSRTWKNGFRNFETGCNAKAAAISRAGGRGGRLGGAVRVEAAATSHSAQQAAGRSRLAASGATSISISRMDS